MTFVDAHAPFGPYEDLNCPVPELRPQMIERLRLTLHIAAEFGVKSVTIHTGNTSIEGYSLAQYDAALEDSLEKLLPLAAGLGVIICIENIWFPTNTPQKHSHSAKCP